MHSSQAALVVGANGGIGRAMVDHFVASDDVDLVVALSRNFDAHVDNPKVMQITYKVSEREIEAIVTSLLAQKIVPRYIVIATGMLHDQNSNIFPEKRVSDIKQASLEALLQTNTVLPILWLKHLSQLLNRHAETSIAVLSARVSSIEDNRLGGWYSYRASKTALNMLLKSLSIEYKLRFPKTKIIAFHPGTTDTELSKPFQANVKAEKLFTPTFVAERLYSLLKTSKADGQLSFKDWDHKDIAW